MTLPIDITSGDPGHIGDHEELHALLDDVVAPFAVISYDQGLFAARPAAGAEGRLYFSTDTNVLYYDEGGSWHSIYEYLSDQLINLLSTSPTTTGLKVPAIRLQKTSTAPQSTAHNVEEAVDWDEVATGDTYDNDGLHTGTSSRITVTREGVWDFKAFIKWDADNTGQRVIKLVKNGTNTIVVEDRAASGGADYMNIATDIEMEDGDYMEVLVTQTSGSTLSVLSTSAFSAHFISDEG